MQLTLKRLFLVNLLTCVTMVADGQGKTIEATTPNTFSVMFDDYQLVFILFNRNSLHQAIIFYYKATFVQP